MPDPLAIVEQHFERRGDHLWADGVSVSEVAAAYGTPLFVYAGAEKAEVKKPFGQLVPGDKTVVPSAVTVLSRFPSRKK